MMNRARSAKWLAATPVAFILGLGAYSILSPQSARVESARALDVEALQAVLAPKTRKNPRSWPSSGPSRQAPPMAPVEVAPKVDTVFDDLKSLDKFQTDLGPITGALRPETSWERFRALGIDTVENKDRAVAIAKQPYSSERSREEVRRKVLAQYFLIYSEQLGVDECMDVLTTNAEEVRASQPDADLTRNYALDVLVLAKICARKGEETVARMAQHESHRTVRGQLLLALESVHE